MADVQRVTIKMSQGGISSGGENALVFLVRADAAISVVDMTGLANDLTAALRAVLFDTTFIRRVSIASIGADKIVKPDTGFTLPLDTQGDNAFPGGAVFAPKSLSLAIEKSTATGQSGRSVLPYVLTSAEFSAYQIANTIPARFTASPAGSYGEGESLSTNLAAALAANNYTFQLPPRQNLLGVTYYPVTSISAQRFVEADRTKKRVTADRALAKAAQRKLNEYAKQVRDLFNGLTVEELAQGVITLINAVVVAATTYYAALALETRVLVKWPAILAEIV